MVPTLRCSHLVAPDLAPSHPRALTPSAPSHQKNTTKRNRRNMVNPPETERGPYQTCMRAAGEVKWVRDWRVCGCGCVCVCVCVCVSKLLLCMSQPKEPEIPFKPIKQLQVLVFVCLLCVCVWRCALTFVHVPEQLIHNIIHINAPRTRTRIHAHASMHHTDTYQEDSHRHVSGWSGIPPAPSVRPLPSDQARPFRGDGQHRRGNTQVIWSV